MTELPYVLIYFFYGLAFFSMGLLVMIEGGALQIHACAADSGLWLPLVCSILCMNGSNYSN